MYVPGWRDKNGKWYPPTEYWEKEEGEVDCMRCHPKMDDVVEAMLLKYAEFLNSQEKYTTTKYNDLVVTYLETIEICACSSQKWEWIKAPFSGNPATKTASVSTGVEVYESNFYNFFFWKKLKVVWQVFLI